MQTFTDVMRHRFILSNLVAKEFKALYRSMALGFLWSLLQPLVLVTVLCTVWLLFFGAGAGFASFVLVALIPYNFFTYCFSGCTGCILNNSSLVKKVKFPRQILPIAVISTHAIHFAIQSTLIVAVLVLLPPPVNIVGPQLLWLPVIVAVQMGLVLGVGMMVAALNVVYRDVQYVVDSVMVVLFWLSPILYDAHQTLVVDGLQQVPSWLGYLYYLNPLAGILEAYRAVLYFGRAPDFATFGMAVFVTLMFGYFGVKWFWVHEKEFADLI